MKSVILSLICILAFIGSFAQSMEKYSRAKIHLDNSHTLDDLSILGVSVDHGDSKKGVYFISDFSKREITKAKKAGFKVDILIDDVVKHYQNQNKKKAKKTTSTGCDKPDVPVPAHFHLGSYGGYFTYTEMLRILDSMQLLYPGLISAKQAIDTFHTIEGRPIYWVRVSNNPAIDQPSKPQILYTSLHHAREPGSLSSNIYYLWYLLENYATNPQVKAIIDNTELYFVPCVNPDGYIYNITTTPGGGGMWRKNKRANLDGSYGVDLNRNYGHQWGYDLMGSSIMGMDDTYRGASAFSEPETRAIKWLCDTNHFTFALNYHSFGNHLLYPWAYTNTFKPKDSIFFINVSSHLTHFNDYNAGTCRQALGYFSNGDSNDWMYGDTTTKPKIFSFTPEVGHTDFGFYPPATEIIPNCQDNLYPNLLIASWLLPFAAITPAHNKILVTPTGYLPYHLQRLGFPDTATYTTNIIPLDGWMTVPATSKVHTGLSLLQQVTDSFSYTLSPSTPNGQQVSYVLQVYNGVYYIRDTVRFYYGKYHLQYTPSTSSLTDWVNVGWGVSSSTFYRAPTSIHSSLTGTGNYINSADITLTTATPADLTHSTRAYLQFFTQWATENRADFAMVSAAIHGSGTFTPLCGKYTKIHPFAGVPLYDGRQPNWVLEEIDLSDYLGQKIDIQFSLSSDASVNEKGYFIDDFSVTAVQDSPQSVLPVNTGTRALLAYPNPAKDKLTVLVNETSVAFPLQLALFDCLGREVLHITLYGQKSDIDISKLPANTYYLKSYNNYHELPVQKVTIVK